MAFSSDVVLTQSYLVVTPDLDFTPEVSLSAVGTNLGQVVAYSPLVDGVNVYDIVLFMDKGQQQISQPETNSRLILIEYNDIIIVNHPPPLPP
jgi:hypothetical protein